jgi:hypothetical protein
MERQVEDDAPDPHLAARDHRGWRDFRVNLRICEQLLEERMAWLAQRILVGHETSSSACAYGSVGPIFGRAWPEAASFA